MVNKLGVGGKKWKRGQSGNPKGRPKGSITRLKGDDEVSARFINQVLQAITDLRKEIHELRLEVAALRAERMVEMHNVPKNLLSEKDARDIFKMS